MKSTLAFLAFLVLLFGCLDYSADKTKLSFSYRAIGSDGSVREGTVPDSGVISIPKDSIYFHARANITNIGNRTYSLRVLDQKSGPYETTLPLYVRVELNGIERDWRKIGWTETLGISRVEWEGERLVELKPGEERAVEAPLFFFNSNTFGSLAYKNGIIVTVLDSEGNSIGGRGLTLVLEG
ncbi:MAG: hypothetical protein ABIF01_00700 [Candidatus Micrarchaeota archaeon]